MIKVEVVYINFLYLSDKHLILALERVPPGYPRRIPLELFSKESLRRIDGLDTDEGMLSCNQFCVVI